MPTSVVIVAMARGINIAMDTAPCKQNMYVSTYKYVCICMYCTCMLQQPLSRAQLWYSDFQSSIIRHSMGHKIDVRLQRLS